MRSLLVFLPLTLLALAALLAGGGWMLMCASLPEFSGRETLPGLKAEVRIYRDGAGIPHIFASSKSDAFMTLGLLHASDRLFQMEMMRRSGSGRLAEVLGKDLIAYDRKIRTLGFSRLVEENYKVLAHDAQQALQDYAHGVNEVLEKNRLPPEFLLLGFKPEPWRPQDSLYWAKLMAWQLSGNMDEEIFRARYAGGDLEKAKALYFAGDGRLLTLINSPVTVRPEGNSGQVTGDSKIKHFLLPVPRSLSTVPSVARQASNAYVLSGNRTQSGKPILANDPHLELNAPVLWYLARIVTPDWEIRGATAPGLPFFPLGQTKNTAWGLTTSGVDVEDLVFTEEKNLKLGSHSEKIMVKGEEPVTILIREGVHGPVVSDVLKEVAEITPPGMAALLQYTGLRANDRTVEALYRMNMAEDAGDIEAATQLYTAPPQNLFYADKNGRIGFIAVGSVPERESAMAGFMPQTDMGDGGFFWRGDLSKNLWPRRMDPPAGFLMNANNAPVDASTCAEFSCALGFDWTEPYRARRLETLLKPAVRWNAIRAAAPMLDIVSGAAQNISRLLIEVTGSNGADEKDILAALTSWQGAMDRAKPEPLIYSAWFSRFLERLYPGMQPDSAQWPKARLAEYRLQQALLENPAASARKKIGQDAAIAFKEALNDLRQHFGPDWRSWRWGEAHKAPLKNLFWSKLPGFEAKFGLGQESDGDAYTLKRAASLHRGGVAEFLNEHGAGYRAVYDLGNPENSLFMIATGESGHILSAYYGNLVMFWNKGAFVTLAGDEAQLKKKQFPSFVLSPSPGN